VIFDSSSPNLTSTELNTSQHSQSHWSSVKFPSRMSSGSVLHPSHGTSFTISQPATTKMSPTPSCRNRRSGVLSKVYRLSCSARSIGVTSAYIPNLTVWFSRPL
jgi:hypothetical protein